MDADEPPCELAQLREKSEKTAAELERRPTAAAVEELTGRIRTLQALVDAEDGDALEAGAFYLFTRHTYSRSP